MRLHSPTLAPKRTVISILIGRTEVNKSKLPSSLAIEPSPDFPDLFLFGLWVSLVLCLPQHGGSLCSIQLSFKQVISSKSITMSIR